MGNKFAFGIDLGTTNSALACYTGGLPETVLVQGNKTIPSVVWFRADGTTVVGNQAYARKGQPDVVYSSKRDMGTDKVYHLTLEDGSQKDVTPVEVAAEVLKAIVRDSDKMYGEVTEAVITVPAYFDGNQRAATRQAAELAGIKLVSMINEPTAAALAYGVNKEENTAETVIVCDVGGGTTDITLMLITNFNEVPEELADVIKPGLTFDVIASGGNNRLGGDDYDEYIISAAKSRILAELDKERKQIGTARDGSHKKKLAENTHIKKFLREHFTVDRYKHLVEKWKKMGEDTQLSVTCKANGEVQNFTFEPADLDKGYISFWKQIESCIDDTVLVTAVNENGEAELVGKHDDPRICIPVGGSTKNRRLLESIQEKFKDSGMEIPNSSFADEAIALGAAVQSAIVKGIANNITLKEINPLPIGVETMGERNGKDVPGVFYPIIPRDITIPVRRAVPYSTAKDNQTEIAVKIYQGTSSQVMNNQCLGTFMVKDLPAKPAGEVTIDLILEVDINGLLTVTAQYDGQEVSVQMNSVLNTATRTYTPAEERTMKYLLSVRDYMESIGDTSSEDYAEVCNWTPGKPVPKYSVENAKAISEFVSRTAKASITKHFEDAVEEEGDTEESEE